MKGFLFQKITFALFNVKPSVYVLYNVKLLAMSEWQLYRTESMWIFDVLKQTKNKYITHSNPE